MNQIFPIVLGQCNPAMHNHMEVDEQWEDINNACNVIRMLCLIQNCEVQQQTRRNDDQTLLEAISKVYNCKQGTASNSEYNETFKQ